MLGILGKTIKKILGSKSDRDIKSVLPQVDEINNYLEEYNALSHDEIRAKTVEFKGIIASRLEDQNKEIEELQEEADAIDELLIEEKMNKYDEVDALIKAKDKTLEEVLAELLPQAFAVIKQTAQRLKDNEEITVTASDFDRDLAATKDFVRIEGDKAIYKNSWIAGGSEQHWQMVHYDVQLIGGIVLHEGKIAEMATGEGKTLVATLPAYLNALPGLGVHIVTVNDYLAKRDAEWMGPIFQFHGLSIDCIDNYSAHSPERKAAYDSDITYGTNNEFGFDYLRDNMSHAPGELVQRKHHYAMVDEVDSVLIDDARTPLIISGPVPKGDQHEFHELKPRIQSLVQVQRKIITQFLTEAKKKMAEGNPDEAGLPLLRAFRGLPRNKALIKFLSEQGVRALLQKTEAYHMQNQNKEMHKADKELYFVIDEKNNQIDLTDLGIEHITGNGEDQSFFVMPDVGAEIAEINKEEITDDQKASKKDELLSDFAVKSERIHSVNQLLKAYALFEKDVEYILADNKVKIVDEQTGRVMEGRRYSDGLHQAIEAKENVTVEAATQTHATVTLQNFFRMYHKLTGMTGTAETEAGELWEIYKLDVVVIPTNRPIVRDDSQDKVFKTGREKFKAVIDEIHAMVDKGRPVLVGTTSVEISELLSRMLSMRKIEHQVLNAKRHAREADIVTNAGMPGTVTIATNMAGRGTDIKLGPGVIESGGLAIVGTERHDSRRVDRQLRGRAGRQGDPGSSQFFVSLEDDLMRKFSSDKIAKVMDRFGFKEGEVIQHSMITNSIERAQKKVEENNFGVRKHLLEYDDVMNSQREVIYKRRKHALFGDRLKIDISNMMHDVVVETCENYFGVEENYDEFKIEVLKNLAVEYNSTKEEFKDTKLERLHTELYSQTISRYHEKNERLANQANERLQAAYKREGSKYERVVVPFVMGNKQIPVVTQFKDAIDSKCNMLIDDFEKLVSLATIDEFWKDHLRQMDELRQNVQNARFEQKDPLLIYKFEAFELFKQMLTELSKETSSLLTHGTIPMDDQNIQQARKASPQRRAKYTEHKDEASENGRQRSGEAPVSAPPRKVNPVRVGPKVGRNDACPCGSGKKFKHCHGKAS